MDVADVMNVVDVMVGMTLYWEDLDLDRPAHGYRTLVADVVTVRRTSSWWPLGRPADRFRPRVRPRTAQVDRVAMVLAAGTERAMAA